MRNAAFVALSLSAAVAGAALAGPAVTGTALYRERIATPPGAVFTATLSDVSRGDAPATEIGRAGIADAGDPPWSFAVPYDPAAIEPAATYAMRAALTVDGRLWFATDTHVPALTRGAGSDVALTLVRVGGAAEPLTLHGASWRLATLGGAPAPAGVEAHLVFDGEGGISGSGGCNRLAGQALARDDGAFLAGRLASTMMACPPPAMEVEQALHKALEAARGWRIEGARLILTDAGGAVLATFEATAP